MNPLSYWSPHLKVNLHPLTYLECNYSTVEAFLSNMADKTAKFADRMEIPDSEDEPLTSSPDSIAQAKSDTKAVPVEALELPVELTRASAMVPEDEQVSNLNSTALQENKEVIENSMSTNDQFAINSTAQEQPPLDEQTTPEENIQETATTAPMDEDVLVSIIQIEEQALLAEDMSVDNHSGITSRAEAPTAPEELPTQKVQAAQPEPLDAKPPSSSIKKTSQVRLQ